MMKRLKSGLLPLVLATFLSSCVMTKAEGEQMMSDLARLKNEVSTLQRQRSDFTIVVDRKYDQINSRVEALESTTYRRASTESSENEQLRRELEALRGELEQTQQNIGAAPGSSLDKKMEEETIPEGKKEHFMWCQSAFDEKNFEKALQRIDSFIEKYRDDNEYGPQAYIIKGDASVMLAKSMPNDKAKKDFFTKAVTAYQDLLSGFPKSARIPEGLYKVGETLEMMGFRKDAKIFFKEIKTKHGKSSYAKKAAAKLKA